MRQAISVQVNVFGTTMGRMTFMSEPATCLDRAKDLLAKGYTVGTIAVYDYGNTECDEDCPRRCRAHRATVLGMWHGARAHLLRR
jgi:hypothetical protein